MKFGLGFGSDLGHVGILGSAGAALLPAAIELAWSPADTADATPGFLTALPYSYTGGETYKNAAVGDHLIIERQLQAGGAWTLYLDHTLIADDIAGVPIAVAGISDVPDGDHYFRGRLERGALIGPNSANVAVTIAASPTDYIELEAGGGYIELEAGGGYIQQEAA